MLFGSIEAGVPDPMYELKKRADGDQCSLKVDLGVGIYRNEHGTYQELQCVKAAKETLTMANPGHDYELTTGNKEFLSLASRVIFGKSITNQKLASVQTISGTGAVHLAVLFISQCISPRAKVYIGVPAWGNYKPAVELVNLSVTEYRHYNPSTQTFDYEATLRAIKNAPASSIFIFQACCHNPTGADPSPEQWDEIVNALQAEGHLPIFDIAYQGLGRGLNEDAYAIQICARRGMEMLVCQSFSKNFALYGERCGALHVACRDTKTAFNVHDRLRCLIRWEISSPPAFGSRLVKIILSDEDNYRNWQTELSTMRRRIKILRLQLFVQLVEVLHTPGDWKHITQEKGLFSYLKLTAAQCGSLVDQYHIYLPQNGRINVSGLNNNNIARVAQAIDEIVRLDNSKRISAKLS